MIPQIAFARNKAVELNHMQRRFNNKQNLITPAALMGLKPLEIICVRKLIASGYRMTLNRKKIPPIIKVAVTY